jgi:signal peptidase I
VRSVRLLKEKILLCETTTPMGAMISEILKNFGRLRLAPIEVQGNSMTPAYSSGDWLLACWFTKPITQPLLEKMIGKPVLVQRESFRENHSDILQLKRLIRIDICPTEKFQYQYWVEGDNRQASTDSRTWGYLRQFEIKGVIIFRYRKGGRT